MSYAHLTLGSVLKAAAIVCVASAALCLTAYLHLLRWQEWGTGGQDTAYYQRIALDWFGGKLSLTYPPTQLQHFRPVLYALMALCYKLFGVQDHSIKILNLLCLAGSSVAIWHIARIHRLSRAWALAPVLTWLWTPAIIQQTRVEQAHLLSTLFVVLAYLAIAQVRACPRGWRRWAGLALAALLTHGAVGSHAELALLVPGLLWGLRYTPEGQGRATGRAWIGECAVFAAVCALPLILYHRIWGLEQVYAALSAERSFKHPFSDRPYPSLTLDLLTRAVPDLLGAPRAWVVSALAAAHVYVVARRRETLWRDLTLLAPCLSYALLLEPVVERTLYVRLVRILTPLLPLVIVYVWARIGALAQALPDRRAARLLPAVAAIGMAVAAGAELRDFPHHQRFGLYDRRMQTAFTAYRTPYRYLHDLLGDRVDKDHRLLIAPSSFADKHATTNLPFYFDGDSRQMHRLEDQLADLDPYLRRHRIRYVYVAPPHLRGSRMDWLISRQLWALYSKHPPRYGHTEETIRLIRALAPYEPRCIQRHPGYGVIWEISLGPTLETERFSK